MAFEGGEENLPTNEELAFHWARFKRTEGREEVALSVERAAMDCFLSERADSDLTAFRRAVASLTDQERHSLLIPSLDDDRALRLWAALLAITLLPSSRP